jgi:hypothetical protein
MALAPFGLLFQGFDSRSEVLALRIVRAYYQGVQDAWRPFDPQCICERTRGS